MRILQIDTTLVNTNGFSDNFFWPLMIIIIVGLFGLVWKYFFRKKITIEIDYKNSYIGNNQNHDYAIIKIKIINETSSPINNLKITSNPNFNLLNNITVMTGGVRNKHQTVYPYSLNLIQNVINTSQPIFVLAENILEGNIIIDIMQKTNKIEELKFMYLNKNIILKIEFDRLQITQI